MKNDWMYDEFSQVGVDYSAKGNVNIYDEQMESFRDYEEETKAFIQKLNVSDPNELTAIDIGCGTGAFSISASKYFKKIHAVDISKEMLNTASKKAITSNIKNIEFHNSGFLQFQPNKQVDIVYTKLAFHHMPDFWKQAALLNMNKMLKPGGIMLLFDVVFKFDPAYEKNTNAMLEEMLKKFSKDFVEETKIHIKDEYSTFDWILKGMIERAGFKIEKTDMEDTFLVEYFCKKVKSFEDEI